MQEYMKHKKLIVAIIVALTLGPYAAVRYFSGPDPVGSKAVIYVDTQGVAEDGAGSSLIPCRTVTQAMALAEDVGAPETYVVVNPGEYIEAGSIDWPDLDNVHLVAAVGGGAVTLQNSGAGPVLVINPGDVGETYDAYIDGIELDHAKGQIGLQIDNARQKHTLIVTAQNLTTNSQAGDPSIQVLHSGAPSVRLYISNSGQEIEGPIVYNVGDNNDRLYVTGSTMGGKVVMQGINRLANVRMIRCMFQDGVAVSEVVNVATANADMSVGVPQFSLIQCIVSDPQMHIYGHDAFRAVKVEDVTGPCAVAVID